MKSEKLEKYNIYVLYENKNRTDGTDYIYAMSSDYTQETFIMQKFKDFEYDDNDDKWKPSRNHRAEDLFDDTCAEVLNESFNISVLTEDELKKYLFLDML